MNRRRGSVAVVVSAGSSSVAPPQPLKPGPATAVVGEDGRELAERYARCSEVRDALIRLPDEQREVQVLAYFGGFTQSEIATHLGVPLGTVKARSFRGLGRLTEFLSRTK
jgi:RNA polymerase sigma factor (sigma-70 family)